MTFSQPTSGRGCANGERTGVDGPRNARQQDRRTMGQHGGLGSCPVCQLHSVCGTRTSAAGRSRVSSTAVSRDSAPGRNPAIVVWRPRA